MSASVTYERKNSSTEGKIVGTLPEVFAEIETQLTEYPPQGYGTFVEKLRHQGGDKYEARIWRSNSCD
jgi:hypothetical protein